MGVFIKILVILALSLGIVLMIPKAYNLLVAFWNKLPTKRSRIVLITLSAVFIVVLIVCLVLEYHQPLMESIPSGGVMP